MNGIRLYGQPLRLQERNVSGSTGGKVEAVPPQHSMGPPQLLPPSIARPPYRMAMHPANLASFNQSISGGHTGLLRSYSEPEGLGRHDSRRAGNLHRVRETSTGPYPRPHAPQPRISPGALARNIASHLLHQAVPRNPQFGARNSYGNPHRQPNHHGHGGFRH